MFKLLLHVTAHIGNDLIHDAEIIAYTIGETTGFNTLSTKAYFAAFEAVFGADMGTVMMRAAASIEVPRAEVLGQIEETRSLIHAAIDGEHGTLDQIIKAKLELQRRRYRAASEQAQEEVPTN